MELRAKVLWERFKANRLASILVILLTLAMGILIGTVVSGGVKGQEKKNTEATPLSMPGPRQLSNQFSQIAKAVEPAVVNINTESTGDAAVDKIPGKTRTVHSEISSISFLADRAAMARRSASARWDPESSLTRRDSLSPTGM